MMLRRMRSLSLATLLAAIAMIAATASVDAAGGGGKASKNEASPREVGVAGAGGELRNEPGKFSLWVPEPWTVAQMGERIIAHNPKDSIQVVAGPLPDRDADLKDEDVIDFVDEELDAMKVVSDAPGNHGGLAARLLAGSGVDEGDAVEFRAVAIDPAEKAPVLIVLVYGESDLMKHDEIEKMVGKILGSFRPL